ncbi:nucleolar protein TMA23 [Geosmithia morbida]|uniref:Nucleolar protein TMA23 n=1 Tax=Geosmithia morbida TaxID=1094350 RepID=A0A9P4Z0S4_9HYPO|nr:nucleolar protein TMA23 [Geosmithia morbida]KAF4125173.1 nucleolar protein TMA23 [Geosmithia morbida]
MDAHALLTAQGWRGHGHSLHHKDDKIGLAKPLLISRKNNTKGLGVSQHFNPDQWWLNAFDEQLKGLETSDEGGVKQTITKGKLNTVAPGSLGRYSVYTSFVSGGFLEGTVDLLKKQKEQERRKQIISNSSSPSSSSSATSDDDDDDDTNSKKPKTSDGKEKEKGVKIKESKAERRARREAKRERKQARAVRRAARQERRQARAERKARKIAKKTAKSAVDEEKRLRRAKKEGKRRKRELEGERELKGEREDEQ